MKTIYKYPLHPQYAYINECVMPEGAQILTMQLRFGVPCVWALVDTDAKLRKVRFLICGTGWDMDNAPGDYVGTFQEGNFVWHVFMRDVE